MPDWSVTLVVGVIASLVSFLGAMVAFRKAPGEILNNNSTTVKNMMETIKMLTDDNTALRAKVENIERVLSGTFEITTRVSLAIPPKVIDSRIRLVPEPAPAEKG